MKTIALASVLVLATITAAPAHDHSTPFADWMMSLKQPDSPTVSCCGPADQVYVDSYEPSRTDPGGFVAKAAGTIVEIPAAKVIWDRVNPTGRGVLFWHADESTGAIYVYCFTPGSGT